MKIDEYKLRIASLVMLYFDERYGRTYEQQKTNWNMVKFGMEEIMHDSPYGESKAFRTAVKKYILKLTAVAIFFADRPDIKYPTSKKETDDLILEISKGRALNDGFDLPDTKEEETEMVNYYIKHFHEIQNKRKK